MSFARYSTYRQSGVDVIGAIPGHWEARSLRQLGRLLKGIGGSKEDVVPEGVPCVRYGDLYTTHAEAIEHARTFLTEDRAAAYTPIKYGDVLFAASGEKIDEIGKSAVNLIRGDARCGGDLIILRPTVPMVPRFLGYAADASTSVAQKTSMGRGTTVKHIYPDELRNLIVAVPPVAEQHAIADFLDRKTAAIDELIAKKERLVALLAEKRQALITQAVTKGLDPTAPMKDSGIAWIGSVPEHWNLRRLRYISNRISGRLVFKPAQYFVEDGVPFLMGNNITQDGIDRANLKYVSEETNAAFSHHALRAGDVVTVRVGAPGVTCVVPSNADGLNCGSMMIIRRALTFSSGWLAFAMNSSVIKTQIDLVQYGAAQEQINISDAVNFVLPVPPLVEQERLSVILGERVNRLRLLTHEVGTSIDRLREYRQALITAAVTGKLDVERAGSQTDDRVAQVAEGA